ncbi:MAG TPA: hypothetical protein VG244_02720, partial [Acidimicrobiales bacterium]|nr:hypothetical protein [Acidimicrobiales bacterium]
MRIKLSVALFTKCLAAAAVVATMSVVQMVNLASTASADGVPTVSTDLSDYAPYQTAHISGTNFAPSTSYDVSVLRPDGTTQTGAGTGTVGFDTVTSDPAGAFSDNYVLNGIEGSYVARVYLATWDGNLATAPLASVTFTDSAISLSQCTNGGTGPPLDLQPCVGSNGGGGAAVTATNSLGTSLTEKNWGSGAAQGSNSHWREGDFISYRTTFSGSTVTAGLNTFTFNYDPVRSGGHAIDYLGSYDATENSTNVSNTFNFNNNSPCQDLVNAGGMPQSDCPIIGSTPAAPRATTPVQPATLSGANNANCGSNGTFTGSQTPGNIALFGPSGTQFDAINPFVYTSENVSSGTGTCTTTVTLRFDVPNTLTSTQSIVIAWGGHIASGSNWGLGNSASSIQGSPYHVGLDSFDGTTLGSQDVAVASSAVFFTPTMTTVVKDALGNPVSSSTPLPIGSVVHDTATLASADPTAGGNVTYSFFTDGNCTSPPAPSTNTEPVSNGVVTNSSATSALAAGSYSYSATYPGDGTDTGTTAACEPFTVGQGTSSVATTLHTTASGSPVLTSPVTLGTSVFDTNTITPIPDNGLVLGGTVSYTLFTDPSGATGCDASATQSSAGSGLADSAPSSTVGPLAAGNYGFEATWTGDGNYAGSTSSCEPFSVSKGSTVTDTTLHTTASGSPVLTSPVTLGTSVFDTNTITPSPAGFPLGGTVSYAFYTDTSGTGCNGTPVAEGTGLANSAPSSTVGPLTAGNYGFEATWTGDANYAGSTSSCEPFSVGMGTSSVATTLHTTASGSPVLTSPVALGTSVFDTNTITP